ncbi:MAG: hypothetical protein QGI45_00950 [Myxococcota bacterium]|nr:hypothetical protein [Myxococcota bacterium]
MLTKVVRKLSMMLERYYDHRAGEPKDLILSALHDIAAPFIRGWAEHMAHLEGALEKDNPLGDFLQRIGVPITHAVGTLLLALDTDAGFNFKLWKIRTQHLSNQELLEIAIAKEKKIRTQRQASTP